MTLDSKWLDIIKTCGWQTAAEIVVQLLKPKVA
jgi:hypothetical protein